MSNIPRLPRLLAVTAAVYLLVFFLLRLGFWLYFSNPNTPLDAGTLAQALYTGLKFDLRLALLIVMPILIGGWFAPLNPLRNDYARWGWLAYLAVVNVAVAAFYIFDFGYFAYLQIRIDHTILRFLDNAMISAQMVWQSYPVIVIVLAFIAAITFITWLTAKLFSHFGKQSRPQLNRKRRIAIATASFFLLLFGIYGKLSWYPLRWSDAFFTTNAFASAVAVNPVLYFYDTFKNGGTPYDIDKVRQAYPRMADYYGVENPDPETLNFSRHVEPIGKVADNPNIVVVLLESFASYKSSVSGNPLDPTPHFQKLADNGILFDNFYTPHTGTARGVFATLTGIADVQLEDTSSMNPTIVDQQTPLTAFEGYEKFYFLGGSANWRNIRGMLSHNIPGLQIYEEGSYQAPRVDVWGMSDLHLFEEANWVLREQEKPFFSIIQTSGNHRPYTIPEDNRGFELQHPNEDEVLRYGFESVEEFNSFRFMDHAIGYFIEQAKKEDYFDNTMFVFFGDHGISGFAGEHRPETDTKANVGSYHTPLVIYGPGLIEEPRRIETIGSQVDVLTTLAAMAGKRHLVKGMGRNLFDAKFADQRYAFAIYHRIDPLFTLIGNDFIYSGSLSGSQQSLYPRLEASAPLEEVGEKVPEKRDAMADLANSIYQTARYMLNHNRPETHSTNK